MRERLVAAAATLSLLAGIVGVFVVRDEDEPLKAWDARVLPLISFVEQERGLRFTHPVPVEFLDDEDFEREVRGTDDTSTEEDKEELEDVAGRLRALGLLQGKVDLGAAYDDLVGASVVGLYQPEEKRVLVRGTDLTPYVRGTLAHELTHVLQDQHFDITKLQDDAPGGDTTAVTALIEGDAVRVEEAYREQLSDSDKKAYDTEQNAGADEAQDRTSDLPDVLTDGLGFPYVFGPVLLDALLSEGGNTAVDRAFRHPPTSEAQVLDPVSHPVTTDPVDVPEPVLPSGAERIGDPGPFGQVFLLQVLGTRLSYDESSSAVAGWTGDSSIGYRLGGKVCNAADVRVATDADATRLVGAVRRWATALPGAQVTLSGTTVAIRTCDPGVALPAPRNPSAYDVLVVRTQVLHELTSTGASYRVGRCVADAVVADGRRDGYRELTSDELSDAALTRLQQVAATAAQRCRG